MTRRKKTDGQRLARLAIDNWPDEIWIAERIDRLIRRRMAEAWEEIERQRNENARLRADAKVYSSEIERLRGALQYMVNVCPAIDPDGELAHELARNTLEGKP